MSVLAIVGAGTMGGSLAHTVARRDLFTQVRLIDTARDIAAGLALDITQAGPIDGFRTLLVAGSGPAAVVGADVVILTGAGAVPETACERDADLVQLRQMAEANRRAVLICAGADHAVLVERGVEAGIDRRRLLGSAPEAHRTAVRALVALEVGVPASEVALTLLGRPPRHAVVPWSQASIGGTLLDAHLSPSRQARLEARMAQVWPLGPYALAAGASHLASCVTDGSGRRPCCFVVMNGEFGVRGRALAAPVEVDALGVVRVLEPSLTARERGQVEAATVD